MNTRLKYRLVRFISPRRNYPLSNEVGICTVLCHQDVAKFFYCISSFFYQTKHAYPAYIIDDGTLSKADYRIINQLLPHVTIEAIQSVIQKSKRLYRTFPSLMKYHQSEHTPVYKLKLDALLLCPFQKFIFLDADIIFFQEPKEIITWAKSSTDSILYCTFSEKYKKRILKSDYLSTMYALRQMVFTLLKTKSDPFISAHLLCLAHNKFMKLHQINKTLQFLDSIGYLHNPHVDEIVLAIAIAQYNTSTLDPEKYCSLVLLSHQDRLAIPANPIALHFPGESKKEFWKFALAKKLRD